MMADDSHLWEVQTFGHNIYVLLVNTLYMRGYSFRLLLMSADSSKVLKKYIRVSNGLDPDQDRRWSLFGAKLFTKVISR